MEMLSFILPRMTDAAGHADHSYHLSLVTSLQSSQVVPLLSLERHSPQDAASLPLALRAITIAIECNRASLASNTELASALMQVLPVAARTDSRGGCEWLYRYCIFLAKAHSMTAGLVGERRREMSLLDGQLFALHIGPGVGVAAGTAIVRSGASIGARMQKWRVTASRLLRAAGSVVVVSSRRCATCRGQLMRPGSKGLLAVGQCIRWRWRPCPCGIRRRLCRPRDLAGA
jgi:hypothetical protein